MARQIDTAAREIDCRMRMESGSFIDLKIVKFLLSCAHNQMLSMGLRHLHVFDEFIKLFPGDARHANDMGNVVGWDVFILAYAPVTALVGE